MAVKKASESFSKSLIDEVQRWGCMKQTGVSLRYMMEFGSRPTQRNFIISAQFLHKELPIRIARRAIELESLPYGLSEKSAVLKQLKKEKVLYEDLDEIHQFLDRFYMSRIGIRMLIGQHVELHNPNPPPHCVGYIDTKTSPMEVARNATEDARAMCLREYGSAPNVNIYGDPDFTFPYVPTHLHTMVFELVKNSLRAVQERFMDSDKVAPPVKLIVADGIEDVTIKVSDEGGGIPRSGLPKIFTYLYSTASNPLDSDLSEADAVTMAGYGYGLPISRLYARYFGGDLQIISMEGYVMKKGYIMTIASHPSLSFCIIVVHPLNILHLASPTSLARCVARLRRTFPSEF
ncbi:hypothetical protein C1H46_030922 [Malus baccata]|uniref:Protein-serine/threonine kinase n=1 Tax=Malus baccata TaxID=106549 RepID=A0A540LAQ0_MALBA|nr:hypothetical protein C1H46_030922 [Malus baccata]